MASRNPDELFLEVHELITAQLQGRLTAEQHARLEWLVIHDPAARQVYVNYVQDTATLDRWTSRKAYQALKGSADGRKQVPRRRWLRLTWGRAGLAALVLLALGAYLLTRTGPAATLAASVDAVWEHRGQPTDLGPGGVLAPGRWRLVTGMAEVAFADGACVVIEAPAELEVADAGLVRLHDGQLVARVPPAAVGFTVATSQGSIIDRGTEFGVRTRQGSPAEVHVFTGLVDAELAAQRQPVKQGAAARLDAAASSITAVPLDTAGFVRFLPSRGLFGEYFDTVDLRNRVTTRVDSVIDLTDPSWDLAPPGTGVTPDGGYSIRWTGFVRVDRPGDWTFTTMSNDGVRLFVNRTRLIDNWKTHTEMEDRATIKLPAAGWYPLRLEYFQSDKTMTMQLLFAGPGQVRQIIPATHLSTIHPVTGEQAGAAVP